MATRSSAFGNTTVFRLAKLEFKIKSLPIITYVASKEQGGRSHTADMAGDRDYLA
jgi:hypothetical protein